MFYSQDVLEDVRTGNDIVDVAGLYTKLKQKGSYYFGLCPFHKESTPSFSVSPDKQIYHCFGCGASGNVFGFVMQVENYGFVEAVKFLADRINYSLPEAEQSEEVKRKNREKIVLYEIHKKSARYYYDMLNSSEGLTAQKYLDERRVGVKIRKKYGLGYSPYKRDGLFKYLSDNGYTLDLILRSGLVLKGKDEKGGCYDRFFKRLMFPIIDVQGRIIGFGGRIIGSGEPKYLNSPETEIFNKSSNLYSINFARASKAREFIIVEGYMDVIALYGAGVKNVVASLGTAFNDGHARLLKKYADSAVILFDSDEAGVNATLRMIPVLIKNGLRVKVLQVEDAKDPDEYIKKFGVSAFNELLKKSQNYISFQVNCIRNRYNMHNTEERVLFTNEVAKILSELGNEIERDAYIKEVAAISNISEDAIKNEMNKGTDMASVDISKKAYAKINVPEKGVNEARKNILNILAGNPAAAYAIRTVLSPYEFVDKTMIRLCEIIYEYMDNNKNVYPAEVIGHFTESGEQKTVSEIFIAEQHFEDDKELEKAVNDQVKFIKKIYIETEMHGLADINRHQELINSKKKLAKLHVDIRNDEKGRI